MEPAVRSAYRACARIARGCAKNFYYGLLTLPPAKRRAMTAVYAFSRSLDDTVDIGTEPGEIERKLEQLRTWIPSEEGLVEDGAVPIALADAVRRFRIPPAYFHELVQGMEMDLHQNRYPDFESLRRYCYHVASVVGLISIEVFGYSHPRAREHAIDLGIAMQLVNILRDIDEDVRRGRIYLPVEDLERFDLREQDILRRRMDDRFRSFMAFQVDRARGYFRRGALLSPLLNRDARACPGTLAGVYRLILDRIEKDGYDVFSRRITVSRRAKLLLAGTELVRAWVGL